MYVSDKNARSFYEIEYIKNHWSTKELERQINFLLLERLKLSINKKGLMKLTRKGLGIQKPEYIIKDFYVLEFIGLKEKTKLREADLEKALIEHLKEFLLELVRGLHSQPARNAIPLMENIFGLPLYFTIPFFSAMSS